MIAVLAHMSILEGVLGIPLLTCFGVLYEYCNRPKGGEQQCEKR